MSVELEGKETSWDCLLRNQALTTHLGENLSPLSLHVTLIKCEGEES